MQNIDPLFVVQPVIVTIICAVLLIYWYRKRRFHWTVFLYSLVAYSVAIALKYAVQIPSINAITGYFGSVSVGLGVYYGLQTAFFEVGLAYLIAWYVISHGLLEKKDAEAYGSGLAFWENAGLLGILSLVNLVAYWSILSSNSPLAQTVYNQLYASSPGLFAPASEALKSVALGTVERVSSILIHFAWGYLCFMAVIFNKKRLFLIALPMGFIDFLVPFASEMGIVVFEAIVFTLALFSVIVAWTAVKHVHNSSAKGANFPKDYVKNTQSLSLTRHKIAFARGPTCPLNQEENWA
jgi:membrane metalloprotease YhfC-like protein